MEFTGKLILLMKIQRINLLFLRSGQIYNAILS